MLRLFALLGRQALLATGIDVVLGHPTAQPRLADPRSFAIRATDAPGCRATGSDSKLHGPAKWTYYYLYVILDIYSRYAVGWMLADLGVTQYHSWFAFELEIEIGRSIRQHPTGSSTRPGGSDHD